MNNQMKTEEKRTLNRSCVGMLDRGDRVFVCGYGRGIVLDPHEPEWIDHKTKCFKKELQGADIRLDEGQTGYFHCNQIIKLEKENDPENTEDS